MRSSPRSLTQADIDHPHPVYVVWELTLRCDQACRHCGSRAGRARRDELSTGEALDLVAQLGPLGVREVTLIGGESYLRPDWLDIVEGICAQGIGISLVTGGRALTAERCAAAAGAGVTSVSVSIDGPAEIHDRLRAVPGSFDRAITAVQAIRTAGMHATVNTQINRENLEHLDALADAVLPLISTWQFQLTTPMGRAADRDQLVLQPWQVLEVLPRLAALSPEARAQGCRMMIANNLGYFGPHEADLRLGGHWIGCQGGRFSLGVQSDGTIKPCSSLPAQRFADLNVRDLPLAEILVQSQALQEVANLGTDDLWGFCKGCYYAEICRGGCPWTAYTLLGRPGNMPYCHHRALELDKQGLRERLLPTGEAPKTTGGFDVGAWALVLEPRP